MVFILPGCEKKRKISKTLLQAQLGCSACMHVRGSRTGAGPISLLGCLLVLLQLGKQRGAADLLEAPLGCSRISASEGLKFLAPHCPQLPSTPGTGQVEKLRHTTGLLSSDIPQGHHWYSAPGLSVPSWIQAVLCFFLVSPLKPL